MSQLDAKITEAAVLTTELAVKYSEEVVREIFYVAKTNITFNQAGFEHYARTHTVADTRLGILRKMNTYLNEAIDIQTEVVRLELYEKAFETNCCVVRNTTDREKVTKTEATLTDMTDKLAKTEEKLAKTEKELNEAKNELNVLKIRLQYQEQVSASGLKIQSLGAIVSAQKQVINDGQQAKNLPFEADVQFVIKLLMEEVHRMKEPVIFGDSVCQNVLETSRANNVQLILRAVLDTDEGHRTTFFEHVENVNSTGLTKSLNYLIYNDRVLCGALSKYKRAFKEAKEAKKAKEAKEATTSAFIAANGIQQPPLFS